MGKKVKSIHFMGIGGSGISGVAMLAAKMGYNVSGCDLEASSAYVKNIFKGHDKTHVAGSDLVVASPAVFYQNSKHPEFLLAKREGKLLTWQEFLGSYLHKGKTVICVAGTHGKSTTTAMVGKLLVDAVLDPLVVVGARVDAWGGNARYGGGKYFVTEADEFFDNFLNYTPDIIILNNIEFDHPDFFKSEKEVFKSFEKFTQKLIGKKLLIVNGEDLGIKKLLRSINLKGINLVKYQPSEVSKAGLKLRVFGGHNLANALGVIELGRKLGIGELLIKKSLASFSGIGRRMELVYNRENIRIYDDYAHHPTAILKTLSGLRQEFPGKRIWAIVEPHGFDRTHKLLSLYKNVFKDADRVIVGPIFKARDNRTFGITTEKISSVSGHNDARGINSFNKIRSIVRSEIKSGDIILVMGAGKSYLWAKNLLKN